MTNKPPRRGSKVAFVEKQPLHMSAREIVDRAAAYGVPISVQTVYTARHNMRARARVVPAPVAPPPPPPVDAAAVVELRSDTERLAPHVLALGTDRTMRAVRAIFATYGVDL